MVDYVSLCRRVRKELGLTQEALARRLDVSASAVGFWESSTKSKRPLPDNLRRMRAEPLSAPLLAEIDVAIKQYEHHPHSKRYSEELRRELHIAVDTILDRGTDEVVKHVARELTRLAGKFGGPPDQPAPVAKHK